MEGKEEGNKKGDWMEKMVASTPQKGEEKSPKEIARENLSKADLMLFMRNESLART